ncbi:uncharacterized protein N7477_001715 [Penicillium maclennaniae]|uniref:uncharacterized protein n=1 Tax=Penicillium maclennaniae TaxID=1343394 RepID=UPI00254239A4|nr:uncharacterized protein N7477_001715 [Penicillium maclennaniae]KAJ5681775.1 hypothetical protein N7477_001715 [Penicillium maclennaniae]
MNKRDMMLGPRPTKACGVCIENNRPKYEANGMSSQLPAIKGMRDKHIPKDSRLTSSRCAVMCQGHLLVVAVEASALHDMRDENQETNVSRPSMHDHQAVLDRLERIEAALGIGDAPDEAPVSHEGIDEDEGVPLRGVWKAVAHLRSITRPPPDESIWSRPIVKRLWSSFLTNLPLLHFLQDRDAFASPTPLLLASILYISALHNQSSELAAMESGYFAAMCSTVAGLVTPSFHPRSRITEVHIEGQDSPPVKRHKAFHNILGLIMASLSSEAYIEATGSWIAMAYRLWLDHCPSELDDSITDWRGLFSGLQVIDIEHASMHMSYPLLPRQPPTPGSPRLDSYQGNAFQGLAEMMHYGLSHFVGRGLPTIWCSINTEFADRAPIPRNSFTEHDSEVIRLWARKLDDWLVKYNGASQPSPSDRQGILILLQYHLHKLYVLSIYHPARGFDISSANIGSVERHELLVSARAVLRLRHNDASIWSNWDLIMITWAAILLLRGVEDGMTHQDDLHLIQAHLQSLERSHQPAASIHTVLSQQLESSMQAMHTPPDTSTALALPGPLADDSWTLFDQEIMPLANPPWLFDDCTSFPNQKPSNEIQMQGLSSVEYDSSISNSVQYASHVQWPSTEQIQSAFPSTLNRIFGSEN